jgi:hypothetical protein
VTPQSPLASLVRFETLRRLFVLGATLAVIAVVLFFALTLAVNVPKLAEASDEMALRLAAGWAPVPIYLWAIWQARTLFARLRPDHEHAYQVLSSGLLRIGVAMSLTAVLSGVIGLYLVLSSEMGGNNARFISAAVPQLALSLIGLALAAVGVLLRRSSAVVAENAALKAKLEGFI